MSDEARGPISPASARAERRFGECGLTDRERDAARSVLARMTAGAAAEALGVEASTVANYRRRAYAKLGVGDARELVARLGERDETHDGDVEATCARLRARGLGETQAQVLALVAAGRSSSEIADELHIAPGTVSSARAVGYRLLRLHSREELAALLAEDPADEAAGAGRTAPSAGPDERGGATLVAELAPVALLVALVVGAVLLALGGGGLSDEPTRAPEGSPYHDLWPVFDAEGNYHPERVAFTAVDAEGTELFGVNGSGQRFGRHGWVTAHMGGMAELSAAVGTEGELGYAPRDAGAGTGSMPLYEKDGTTVIGTFAHYTDQDGATRNVPDPATTPFVAYTPEGRELFGINASGQTFGSQELADLYLHGQLDLIASVGDGGQRGYLSAEEASRVGMPEEGYYVLYDREGVAIGRFSSVSL